MDYAALRQEGIRQLERMTGGQWTDFKPAARHRAVGLLQHLATAQADEANLILEGIGLLPFVKVYPLVAKLQEQARRQVGAEAANSGLGTADTAPSRALGT